MTNGIDYNTQRKAMPMPEYGRGIYTMIEHAMSLDNRAERQQCAQAIIKTMRTMHPELKQQPDSEQKLWDHLAIMSNFELDIDYPYDIEQAKASKQRPEPMKYPKQKPLIRHYGSVVMQMIDSIINMEKGPQRDELIRLTANQMKRDLLQWGHSSSSEERVIDDLARLSDGAIQLDTNFKFEHVQLPGNNQSKKKKKK